MLKNVPKTRLLLYIILSGLLPIFAVVFSLYSNLNEISEIRNGVQEIQQMSFVQEKKQATSTAVRQHFRDADHFYIDKYLETLSFLEPEIESLQKIQSNENFIDDEVVRKRLDFLTGQGNSLVFSEGMVQSTPILQETLETLVHPVEINSTDLQKILTKIEGVPMGSFESSPQRPQLIITDFRIDRKAFSEKNEVFVLNLKLLKREFP